MITIAAVLVVLIVIWILLKVNKLVFNRIQKKQPGLHLMFLQRVNGAVILIGGIILMFSLFGGIDSVWKTLLGGTAIVSAVAAFAAQDVLKDVLSGLMISAHKPFEIGNRVELEDGTAGIIKEISMRHVVIQTIETQRLVIPNSKLNAMSIKNFSYHVDTRSAMFNFYVAYNTDVEKAMQVIREAVMSSEHTIPGRETPNGPEYGQVYFMAYTDSALRLTTTAYFESDLPSEVLISHINLRVNKALKENGIEIPYNYVNVIQRPQDN